MKRFIATLTVSTLALTACQQSVTPSEPAKSDTRNIMGQTPAPKQAMVAAANPYAVEAGLEILRKGGSAVDAAIAVQTVLGLVEPQSSGIAGGAFMVLYDNKTGEVWAYDGRETAPSGVTPDLFLDENGEPMSRIKAIQSGRSTGVPGVMVMLDMAHKDYGKLDWAQGFKPGIALAEKGFEVSPRLAGLIKRAAQYGFGKDANTKAYFFHKDGTPFTVGDVRDNKPYAEALKALAKNPRALLEGPIAERIVASVQNNPVPGTLTLDDMAKHHPLKHKALCSPYRDYTVCSAQPPSSGGVAVQSILGTLNNFDMSAMGNSADGWHHFAEASFLAYADRDHYVGDPAFVEVPTEAMIDADYLKSRAALIKPDSAMKNVKAGDPAGFVRGKDATADDKGTSHFTVVDNDGLVVSVTTTVESLFGSMNMVDGFMLNNQLTDFSFRAVDKDGNRAANAVAAGKRPRSSMAPSIVFDKDGEFLFSTGSPGGSSIIAYTAKTIVGILDWDLTPQEAVELPNVIARNGSVRLEERGLDEAVIQGLEDKGHRIVRSKGEISGLHIIKRHEDGTLSGGADIRREGVARPVGTTTADGFDFNGRWQVKTLSGKNLSEEHNEMTLDIKKGDMHAQSQCVFFDVIFSTEKENLSTAPKVFKDDEIPIMCQRGWSQSENQFKKTVLEASQWQPKGYNEFTISGPDGSVTFERVIGYYKPNPYASTF